MLAIGQMHQIGAGAATGDLAEVIECVCADLLGDAATPFRFDFAAENLVVPAHKAAVVALIANELVVNAVKHGFRDRASGTVTVRLRRTGAETVALAVADDGAPLPASVDNELPKGIGLDLVRRLVDQLGGELVVDAEPKRFTVVFSADGVHR